MFRSALLVGLDTTADRSTSSIRRRPRTVSVGLPGRDGSEFRRSIRIRPIHSRSVGVGGARARRRRAPPSFFTHVSRTPQRPAKKPRRRWEHAGGRLPPPGGAGGTTTTWRSTAPRRAASYVDTLARRAEPAVVRHPLGRHGGLFARGNGKLLRVTRRSFVAAPGGRAASADRIA